MVEQNVWRSYQTKLLGGGLLLIAIIIIAAFLSHPNHPAPVKQEVELTLQPQPNITPAVQPPSVNGSTNANIGPTPEPASTLPAESIELKSNGTPEPAVEQTLTSSQPSTAAPAAATKAKMTVTQPTKVKHHAKTKPIANKAKPAKHAGKSLHAMLAQHYTIQLLGVNSKQNALLFMQQHGLKGKAAHYVIVHQAKPWHIVVYGQFQTKAQARAAIQKLSPALRKLKPFVRSYAEINKTVKAH